MPALRWKFPYNNEDADWAKAEEDLTEFLLENFLTDAESTGETQNPDEDTSKEGKASKLPEELPILPLRGLVVYPQTTLPLTIGQPRSIQLVDDVSTGQRLIGLVASKDPEKENPVAEDLFAVGTMAIIHRLFRAPDGTIRLLIQGLARFKITEFTQHEPYLKARVEAHPESEETGIEMDALARNVRDQFVHIAEMIPSIPRELVASIASISSSLAGSISGE